MTVDHDGGVHIERFFERGHYLLALCDAHAFNAERGRELYKVGGAVRVGLREASAVEQLLPLAHHAEHRIVHNEHDDGQVVGLHGDQLVEVHVEAAVAREQEYALVRMFLIVQYHSHGLTPVIAVVDTSKHTSKTTLKDFRLTLPSVDNSTSLQWVV